MWESIAGGLAGAAIAQSSARRFVRRRAVRLANEGQAELGLRVVAGSAPGLRPTWRYGLATLSVGRLELRGYVGGVRFLRRAPVVIEVTAIHPATRREPTKGELLRLSRDCDLVQITTSTGTVELAVLHPVRWQWVLGRLSGQS
jgi:hypothetical protein